jgi:hypothetical protein
VHNSDLRFGDYKIALDFCSEQANLALRFEALVQEDVAANPGAVC